MTLLQGIINAFVMVLARIIAHALASRNNRNSSAAVNSLVVIVLQICLSILGSVVICWFSRKREFSADRGSAELAGKQKMIAALRALQRTINIPEPKKHESFAALQISSKGSFVRLFSTHPDLGDRIKALEENYSI